MYLGIDYGKKRIGLALGEMLPYGAGVLDATQGLDEVVNQIDLVCRDNEVNQIVIGMPIRSQGERGTLAEDIEELADAIRRKTGLPVVFEPEQFTSYAAKEELLQNQITFTRKSGKIDELSAILILEQYINSNK